MFQHAHVTTLNLSGVQSRLQRQYANVSRSFGWLINNEDAQITISHQCKYTAISLKSNVFIIRNERQQISTIENAFPLEGERATSLLWLSVHDNQSTKNTTSSRTVLLVGSSEGYLRIFSADTTELLFEQRFHTAPLLKMKIESSFHFR
jgi:hypothetical protein